MVTIPAASGFLDTDRIVSLLGVSPGMRTADLGCGTGFFSMSLARAVGKDGAVSAVDVMQEPLEAIQARAEAAGLGNIHPIRADLEVLGSTGIPDNSQDLTLLASTLFQSKKKDAMLREAIRMLKSGGRLAIIEWKKGAMGLGPPDEMRTSESDMKALAEAQQVKFDKSIDAGQFHYGLIFMKP